MIDMGFAPQIQSILDALPVTNLRPHENITDEDSLLEVFKRGERYRQTGSSSMSICVWCLCWCLCWCLGWCLCWCLCLVSALVLVAAMGLFVYHGPWGFFFCSPAHIHVRMRTPLFERPLQYNDAVMFSATMPPEVARIAREVRPPLRRRQC